MQCRVVLGAVRVNFVVVWDTVRRGSVRWGLVRSGLAISCLVMYGKENT